VRQEDVPASRGCGELEVGDKLETGDRKEDRDGVHYFYANGQWNKETSREAMQAAGLA
jgi:hypothetical protein